MRFKARSESGVLGVLAVALAIFFLADVGAFAMGRSSATTFALRAVANQAPDAACQAVLLASDKLFTTPYHMYMTLASGGIENGKPVSSEMVFAGGARYVLTNGKWGPSPLSTEELKAMEQRNRSSAKNVSCRYVRDETVNGETTALYSVHTETPRSNNDDQIWVSKGKGLILRQETDLDNVSTHRKTHMSARYEYNNVQVPTL